MTPWARASPHNVFPACTVMYSGADTWLEFLTGVVRGVLIREAGLAGLREAASCDALTLWLNPSRVTLL